MIIEIIHSSSGEFPYYNVMLFRKKDVPQLVHSKSDLSNQRKLVRHRYLVLLKFCLVANFDYYYILLSSFVIALAPTVVLSLFLSA